jgi:hypothetical protein
MVDGIFVPNGIQKNRFVSLQLIILTCWRLPGWQEYNSRHSYSNLPIEERR